MVKPISLAYLIDAHGIDTLLYESLQACLNFIGVLQSFVRAATQHSRTTIADNEIDCDIQCSSIFGQSR